MADHATGAQEVVAGAGPGGRRRVSPIFAFFWLPIPAAVPCRPRGSEHISTRLVCRHLHL